MRTTLDFYREVRDIEDNDHLYVLSYTECDMEKVKQQHLKSISSIGLINCRNIWSKKYETIKLTIIDEEYPSGKKCDDVRTYLKITPTDCRTHYIEVNSYRSVNFDLRGNTIRNYITNSVIPTYIKTPDKVTINYYDEELSRESWSIYIEDAEEIVLNTSIPLKEDDLSKKVKKYGFKNPRKYVHDNSSMFRALVDQLYYVANIKLSYNELRKQICDKQLELNESLNYTRVIASNLIEKMRKEITPGEEWCISGFVELYQCQVKLYSANDETIIYNPFATSPRYFFNIAINENTRYYSLIRYSTIYLKNIQNFESSINALIPHFKIVWLHEVLFVDEDETIKLNKTEKSLIAKYINNDNFIMLLLNKTFETPRKNVKIKDSVHASIKDNIYYLEYLNPFDMMVDLDAKRIKLDIDVINSDSNEVYDVYPGKSTKDEEGEEYKFEELEHYFDNIHLLGFYFYHLCDVSLNVPVGKKNKTHTKYDTRQMYDYFIRQAPKIFKDDIVIFRNTLLDYNNETSIMFADFNGETSNISCNEKKMIVAHGKTSRNTRYFLVPFIDEYITESKIEQLQQDLDNSDITYPIFFILYDKKDNIAYYYGDETNTLNNGDREFRHTGDKVRYKDEIDQYITKSNRIMHFMYLLNTYLNNLVDEHNSTTLETYGSHMHTYVDINTKRYPTEQSKQKDLDSSKLSQLVEKVRDENKDVTDDTELLEEGIELLREETFANHKDDIIAYEKNINPKYQSLVVLHLIMKAKEKESKIRIPYKLLSQFTFSTSKSFNTFFDDYKSNVNKIAQIRQNLYIPKLVLNESVEDNLVNPGERMDGILSNNSKEKIKGNKLITLFYKYSDALQDTLTFNDDRYIFKKTKNNTINIMIGTQNNIDDKNITVMNGTSVIIVASLIYNIVYTKDINGVIKNLFNDPEFADEDKLWKRIMAKSYGDQIILSLTSNDKQAREIIFGSQNKDFYTEEIEEIMGSSSQN